MERTISVEEKIRRAEAIYERRKQGNNRPLTTVSVNTNKDKKDIKLLKKMVIQILVCMAIYLAIYTIQNNQYVFSEDFTNKVNEILSYDTNFGEIYNNAKNKIMGLFPNNQEQNSEEQNNEEQNAIGGAVEENTTEGPVDVTEPEQEQELSQTEQDIQNVKNTTTFIKPIEGTISSKFGQRDTATGSVPKNHTGTDIAANLGTKIKSATDGEVVLSSEGGDY